MKKIFRWLIGILVGLVIIIASLIGPVDFTPLTQQSFYQETMKKLDSIEVVHHQPQSQVRASWAAINITPESSMPMAGYAPRDHFDKVHDSIYVRLMGIDNGSTQCFIISADLLLFPPALKNKIAAKTHNKNRFLYFTATHAHSSLGAWNNSVIGNLILGKYDEAWINNLADKIVSSIERVSAQMKPASVTYFEAQAEDYVENRLDPQRGSVDGIIRGLKIYCSDGSKALLASYSAHPTNISHLSLELSGDYPNALVKKAEDKDYDFAMFAAGMVGSHRIKGISQTQFEMCDTIGSILFKKIQNAKNTLLSESVDISTGAFPVKYGPSQLHVLQKFKVRDWAFNLLFTPLTGEIYYLKIGKVIMLGTPCDFSGEIFVRDGLGQIAEKQNEKLFITSFNGDYIGYITFDDHYGHSEQEEVMAMNWVGPYYGQYYSEIVKKILAKK